jgi:hypothetical protein
MDVIHLDYARWSFPGSADGTPLSLKAIFGSLPLIQYELRPGGRPGLNVLQQWITS